MNGYCGTDCTPSARAYLLRSSTSMGADTVPNGSKSCTWLRGACSSLRRRSAPIPSSSSRLHPDRCRIWRGTRATKDDNVTGEEHECRRRVSCAGARTHLELARAAAELAQRRYTAAVFERQEPERRQEREQIDQRANTRVDRVHERLHARQVVFARHGFLRRSDANHSGIERRRRSISMFFNIYTAK